MLNMIAWFGSKVRFHVDPGPSFESSCGIDGVESIDFVAEADRL